MRYIQISLFILCSFFCHAQQKIIDSLNFELSKHSDPDQYRFNILNSLTYYYHLIDPNKGIEFSDKAIKLAKELKYRNGLAAAYKNRGINYQALSQDSLALLMYDKSIDIQKQIGNENGVARNIFNKGTIYFGNSDYLRSYECTKQAYDIFEKEGDSVLMGKALNSMGITLMYSSKYTEAVNTYLQALKIYDNLGMSNTLDYASIFANMGILHNKLKNYDLAIEYQNAAREIYEEMEYYTGIANTYNSLGNIYDTMNKPLEAISYYEKSQAIMEKINNQQGVASALTNIGIAYNSLKQYDKSLDYLNQTKEMYQELGNLNSLSIVFSAIGDNYIRKFEIHGNKTFLNLADKNFQLAHENAINTEDLHRQIQTLDELAKVNELLSNYSKAYKIKVQVEKLKDSLALSEKKEEIARLESEFKFQRKEAELNNKHEIEQAQSLAKLSREKLLKKITIIGSSLLILLIIIGFLLNKRKREAITKALIAETELKALRSQMNPHFIFNSLNSIGDYVLKNDKESATNYLSKFSKLMRQILENSEKKLIPLSEDIDILKNYLEIEKRRFNDKFTYAINIDDNIDSDNTLIPPLILQPFIENSIVHGFKGKDGMGVITITIFKENNTIVCSVDDNGVGRKKEIISSNESSKISMGTRITKNRIDIINKQQNKNGKVEIIDKEQGTLVKVSLPLQLAF